MPVSCLPGCDFWSWGEHRLESATMPSTRDLLDTLKIVRWPARPKVKSPPTQADCDLDLECPDLPEWKGRLVLWVRVNTLLPESFSIGIRFETKGLPPLVLARLNGGHGPHENPDGTRVERHQPHLHLPLEVQMNVPPSRAIRLEHATPLDWELLDVALAWRRFATLLNVRPDEQVDALMSELRDTGAEQLTLGDLHGS